MPITKCKAKDVSNCRYHSKSVHAKMNRDAAQEEVTTALEAFGSVPSKANQDALAFLQTKLVKADIVYASFDEGAVELSAAFKAATGQQKSHLGAMIMAAQKERADRAEREIVEAAARKRFNQIKKEVKLAEKQTSTITPEWQQGYNKAIGHILASEGKVVYHEAVEPTTSGDRYYYGGREDNESTAHLRNCGALQVKEIADENYDEFMDTFADAEDTINYCVRGKFTCNCGKLVEQYVELKGDFTDLTRRVANQ